MNCQFKSVVVLSCRSLLCNRDLRPNGAVGKLGDPKKVIWMLKERLGGIISLGCWSHFSVTFPGSNFNMFMSLFSLVLRNCKLFRMKCSYRI